MERYIVSDDDARWPHANATDSESGAGSYGQTDNDADAGVMRSDNERVRRRPERR
jgi:hypothetical protein